MAKQKTITLESYALNSYNYFNRMIDKDGLPYFDIFWTDPAEAAHDWPDFGDVMTRQCQAAVMGRVMTGERSSSESIWHDWILELINPQDGLLYRPETNFTKHEADMGDASLTLYALVTAYAADKNPEMKQAVHKMVSGLSKKLDLVHNDRQAFPFNGFMIKGLAAAARFADCEQAATLAKEITQHVFNDCQTFSPDNTFQHGGHMHGNLRTLVGAADVALMTGDPILYSRINSIYQYVKSITTAFGFLPEAVGRESDIVLCETCALMDFIGIAVTLANHGHPEYWDDVERMTRNQLIESQAKDLSWLRIDQSREDTHQFSWHDIDSRLLGAYAGWSSPTHFLAAKETLNHHWGGPELRNKTRLFQNCCGGSGTHAFFIVWKNAARVVGNTLWVNLHFDKSLPQAEIRCYQPYEGKTEITIKENCHQVAIRIPAFTTGKAITVEVNQQVITPKIFGNYCMINSVNAGDLIQFIYPLIQRETQEYIGNPGWATYSYRVTWKGDTVIKMTPEGNEAETGYSDFDSQNVPIFYGDKGPCRLYQRDNYLTEGTPDLSPITLDNGDLDMWWFGDK